MPTDYSKLAIVHHPDPVLRRKAAAVRRFDADLRRLADRMLELMREAPGVGLAAPQVGQSIRLFVANPTGQPEDDGVFVNPVLSQPFGELDDYEEGCLSLPGVRGTIRRPKGITISAQDLEGKPFTLTSDQLAARVWQHETDHLDGVLILDRMSRIDKLANRRAVKELEGE
jgi:peptide deformylase